MGIEKIIIICKLGKKSQRGYYFREPAVREFIESESWRKRKNDKTALGSITHLSRRKPDDLNNKDSVGAADYQLVDKTTVSTVLDLFIEDGYWKARVLIFDPEEFKGTDAYDDIKYITGLINSGVKLRSSAGIRAYYNPVTNEGEKIYDFVGIDFTQSPDFLEGGME